MIFISLTNFLTKWYIVMRDLENYLLQFVLVYCADDPDVNAQVKKILNNIKLKNKNETLSPQKRRETYIEPYRVCRRVNILRDYPDDKTKLYPRN